jgi:hypothetical protein
MSTTPDTASAAAGSPDGTPNEYQLHGNQIHLTYSPDGTGPPTTDGPIVLTYADRTQSLSFRRTQVAVSDVPHLGSCVTVVLKRIPDIGTTCVTLLIPEVVLKSGEPATIRTELITTVESSPFAGIGNRQRQEYSVVPLRGEASFIRLHPI